jgi:hypothetical protein
MNESKKTYGQAGKLSSATTLGTLALITLLNPSNPLHASKPSLLERYRGSHHEKALDAQIKAYRPYALKNARTFGNWQRRTDRIFSISIHQGSIKLKQRNSQEKPASNSQSSPKKE